MGVSIQHRIFYMIRLRRIYHALHCFSVWALGANGVGGGLGCYIEARAVLAGEGCGSESWRTGRLKLELKKLGMHDRGPWEEKLYCQHDY